MCSKSITVSKWEEGEVEESSYVLREHEQLKLNLLGICNGHIIESIILGLLAATPVIR